MWIASDGGLAHYNSKKKNWQIWTRAEGLLENEIAALVCDEKTGDIIIGYQTKGISIGRKNDGFSKWKNYPTSNIVNSLNIDKKGRLFVGTTDGISVYKIQRDGLIEIDNIFGEVKKSSLKLWNDSLVNRYVNYFLEIDNNIIMFSTRERGIYICDYGKRYFNMISKTEKIIYPTSLIYGSNNEILIGTYGYGVKRIVSPKKRVKVNKGKRYKKEMPVVPMGNYSLLNFDVRKNIKKESVSPVVFLRDDWETKGNWWGRYGSRCVKLCSMFAQNGDEDICMEIYDKYRIKGRIGAKNKNYDGMRRWLHWITTDNRNSLWLHRDGIRRQAEWDDHGENYPREHDGPNLFIKVMVPEGIHDVALYFFNKDARNGINYCRDYLIEVSKYDSRFSSYRPDGSYEYYDFNPQEKIFAKTRVKDFWNGVYKIFRIYEKGEYLFKISKQSSFNTILSAVLISGAHEEEETEEKPYMNTAYLTGGVVYKAKKIFCNKANEKAVAAFKRGCRFLELAKVGSDYDIARFDMIRLYSMIQKRGFYDLLENIRWKIYRWKQEDYDKFEKYIKLGWTGRQLKYKQCIKQSYARYAKNTISDEDFENVITNKNLTFMDWYDKVQTSNKMYIEEPSVNFLKNSVYGKIYVFRRPVETLIKEFKMEGKKKE